MPQAVDPEPAVPARELLRQLRQLGIGPCRHARLRGAMPPVMVRGEDAQDLGDQIVRWERLNGQAG